MATWVTVVVLASIDLSIVLARARRVACKCRWTDTPCTARTARSSVRQLIPVAAQNAATLGGAAAHVARSNSAISLR